MDAADEYFAFQAALPKWFQTHWEEAELLHMQSYYEHPELEIDSTGVVMIKKKARCPHGKRRASAWPWEPCKNTAGYRTTHEGFGKCYRCDGHNGRGLRQGAILMGLAYAAELQVTPWEALLSQCRLLANQVEWLRARVNEYENTYGVEGIKPGGDGYWAVEMLEQRGDRLAKVAKSCIDAGIARTLVEQVNLEAAALVKATNEALDSIGVMGLDRDKALEVLTNRLLELEANPSMLENYGKHLPSK